MDGWLVGWMDGETQREGDRTEEWEREKERERVLIHQWVPCITATHLWYSFLSLKLPPPPCAELLVKLCYLEWSPPWHMVYSDRVSDISSGNTYAYRQTYSGILSDIYSEIFVAFCLAFFVAFFLTFFPTVFPAFYLVFTLTCLFGILWITFDIFCGILSDSLSGMCSDILSGIYSSILFVIFSGIHSGMMSRVDTDTLCGILSGVCSDTLSGRYSDILSDMRTGPWPAWSGACDRVRVCAWLEWSGARDRVRVRVRACPDCTTARHELLEQAYITWAGALVPTVAANWHKEDVSGGVAPLIKPRDPHLAGGENTIVDWLW